VPRPTKTRPPKSCTHCGQTHRPAGAKQAKFAAEYQKDLNATQAAIRAGYSKRSAERYGFELLKKPSVACVVQRKAQHVAERADLDAAFVIHGLMEIAAVDLSRIYHADGTLMSIHDWPEEIKKVVAGMETDEITETERGVTRVIGHTKKLKLPDRIKAFELLGKHKALFTEVIRNEGKM